MSAERYDVIVAGVGAMGAAACYYLARRGLKVLGLEKFRIPHDQGSYHGVTRAIRIAYFEGGHYVAAVRRALGLWQDVQRDSGREILIQKGILEVGPEGSALIESSIASCTDHGLPHERLTRAQLTERYAHLEAPEGFHGLYQPDGGFLASEEAVVTLCAGARAAGADIREEAPVLGWSADGRGVVVETPSGPLAAGRLVLSAGARLAQLTEHLAPLAVPERQMLGWFAPVAADLFSARTMPPTLVDNHGDIFYLLPEYDVPGAKIGRHVHHTGATDPDDDAFRLIRPEDESGLRTCLKKFFPRANGPLIDLKTCLYTTTPDHGFVIDTDSDHENVLILSVCSGHGFKFAPAIGEYAADWAQGREARINLSPFRLARFT